MSQRSWAEQLSKGVADEVRRYRELRGLSAQQLADACNEAGMSIQRSVIANFENGRRSSVGVAELLIFAHVLNVPPVALICPAGFRSEVEILPGVSTDSYEAAEWVSGNEPLEDLRDRDAGEYHDTPISHFRAFMEEFLIMETENDTLVEMEEQASRAGINGDRAEAMHADARQVQAAAEHQLEFATRRMAEGDVSPDELARLRAEAEYARHTADRAHEALQVAMTERYRAMEFRRKMDERQRGFEEYQARAREVISRIREKGYLLPPIPGLWESAFLEEESKAPIGQRRYYTRKE